MSNLPIVFLITGHISIMYFPFAIFTWLITENQVLNIKYRFYRLFQSISHFFFSIYFLFLYIFNNTILYNVKHIEWTWIGLYMCTHYKYNNVEKKNPYIRTHWMCLRLGVCVCCAYASLLCVRVCMWCMCCVHVTVRYTRIGNANVCPKSDNVRQSGYSKNSTIAY